jgi:hypothetical protein
MCGYFLVLQLATISDDLERAAIWLTNVRLHLNAYFVQPGLTLICQSRPFYFNLFSSYHVPHYSPIICLLCLNHY